jgi:hypothetical protein
LTKLSFVRISFLFRNHMKILIFSGTFIFHRYFLRNLCSCLTIQRIKI